MASSATVLGQQIAMEFGEGDATKQKSVKRRTFSLNEDKALRALVGNSTGKASQ